MIISSWSSTINSIQSSKAAVITSILFSTSVRIYSKLLNMSIMFISKHLFSACKWWSPQCGWAFQGQAWTLQVSDQSAPPEPDPPRDRQLPAAYLKYSIKDDIFQRRHRSIMLSILKNGWTYKDDNEPIMTISTLKLQGIHLFPTWPAPHRAKSHKKTTTFLYLMISGRGHTQDHKKTKLIHYTVGHALLYM